MLTSSDEITLVVYRENLIKPGSSSKSPSPLPPSDDHRGVSPSGALRSPYHQGSLRQDGPMQLHPGPTLTAPGSGPTPTVRIESLPVRNTPQLQPPPSGRFANQTGGSTQRSVSPIQRQTQPVSPLARTTPTPPVGAAQQGGSLVDQFNQLAKKTREHQQDPIQPVTITAITNVSTITSGSVGTVVTSNSTMNHHSSPSSRDTTGGTPDGSLEDDDSFPSEVSSHLGLF